MSFFAELRRRNVIRMAGLYDPPLASLHGDPGFEALAEKIVLASQFRTDSK